MTKGEAGMSKTPWTPWHKGVKLREDVRTGELSMAMFAADLHEVAMRRGTRRVYEDPAQFFALTYPTANLRALARDVVLRLAGRNQKAIRQLELTYGGGKTHTLITLYHLVNDPAALPDLRAVREFREHIGIEPPPARIAILSFDKLDVEKGMEVRDPGGQTRRLRQPWSVLAWQLAGEAGLRMLHAEDRAEERESAPSESLLEPLLREPQRAGLATLVLIDEVLMYAHEKVSHQREWLGRLKNFFQYLCQATVKVDRAAIVASLLATDPLKSDELGKQIIKEIYEIFAREREEGVQPVLKEDVAEVLRRRFFTPESIESRDAFRPHVFAALQGIADLDETTRRNRKAAEERFVQSYPFHPDLTEVFYGKWTGMDSFQRTRGALRTFALALREAVSWDMSPLVGPNVFLSAPGADGISEAARELTSVASKEQTEGTGHNWSAILEGELKKARGVQEEIPGIRFREIEQAVFSTFIHSQPIGAKARVDELLTLVGATRPDRISLEKGLRLWFDRSWFLDESADAEVKGTPGGPKPLPVSWRLGAKPNLRQMHEDACGRVPDELVDVRLVEDIRKLRSLTMGASAAGARVHMLPEKPSDIEDDGAFHYAVLGPGATSESGRPSGEARRFLEENTGPSNPRKERNAVVLAVPSREGLYAARQAVREYLGWEGVKDALKGQEIDPIRSAMLAAHTEAALKKIPATVAQAYCIVVTISEADEVQAFKIQVGDQPLFQTVKADRRSRLQDTAISADAILPGGPYDLWREGEDARRVKDLVGAFARFPRLPKMLDRKAILDTIVTGCVEGVLVGRLRRPDKSVRTFWRERPDGMVLDDPGFEVVLPDRAELNGLAAALLYPHALPDLWKTDEITIGAVHDFFSGQGVIGIDRGGYVENLAVPAAPRPTVDAAIASAVRDGKVWLTSGPASLLGEEVPPGLLADVAVLQSPPAPIAPLDLLPDQLTPAWSGSRTNGLALWTTLSQKVGKNLPWFTVREAIDGAMRARVIEPDVDCGAWPCDATGAGTLRLRVASTPTTPPGPVPGPGPAKPGVRVGEADLSPGQVQDLAEVMGDLLKAKAGYELTFHLRVEIAGKQPPPDSVVEAVNEVLKQVNMDVRVR
jgi:hypothetical protein